MSHVRGVRRRLIQVPPLVAAGVPGFGWVSLRKSSLVKAASSESEGTSPSSSSPKAETEDFTPSEPTAEKKHRVVILGSAGGVGKLCADQLNASGEWTVRAAIRPNSDKPTPTGADEVVTCDVYEYETLPPALKDCDACIIAVGTTNFMDPLGPFKNEYQGTKNVIAAAKQQGVTNVVLVTSMGVEDILYPLNLAWGVLFWKKLAEEELQRSGLRHVIVRPGGLSNDAVSGAVVFKRRGSTPGGRVSRANVARVVIEALTCENADNKIVEVVQEEGATEKPLSDLFESIVQSVSRMLCLHLRFYC